MRRFKLFSSEEDLKRTVPEGSRKMVRIGDKRVCIIHHHSGYKVIDNLCPHNGHSLFEGKINHLDEIVCPLHGYRYRLLDGRECDGKSGDLKIHRLDIEEEGVFLSLID